MSAGLCSKSGRITSRSVSSTYRRWRDGFTTAAIDFLTWFEHAPEHTRSFDELLARLRGSEEWKYVERECELRLVRD